MLPLAYPCSANCFGYLVVETGVKQAIKEAVSVCFAFFWAAKPVHDIGVQCDLPTMKVVHDAEPCVIPIGNANLEARLSVWRARR